ARLEEAGLWVEGGVFLVRFGWDGGFALMRERGYHMEALYDVWEDFTEHMEGEEKLVRNPTKAFVYPTGWSSQRAPEGLHPAHLARVVLEKLLESEQLLLPPERLDRDYDGRGGIWISLRSRRDIHLRHARNGFWHFPGEPSGPVPRDL